MKIIPTTIETVLPWAHGILSESSVPESLLNAELLLAHATGIERLRLRIEGKREVTSAQLSLLTSFLARRSQREPLQYIMGTTEFMGLTLAVNPFVLIPRPETEVVVGRAIDLIRASIIRQPKIIDVGTGSGNIALAIRRFIPDAVVTATDISSEALDTAIANSRRNCIDGIDFRHEDLFSVSFPGRKFDFIVSNPPYVSSTEFTSLEPEVRLYEPMVATTDGADGLRFIRALLRIGAEWLNPGGSIILEVGYGQADEAVREAGCYGFVEPSVQSDLAGVPRVFSASVQPGMVG
jgi:release factor glutamine methyltransferase